MLGIASSWAFLFEHPIVGVAVFVAVTLGVILALSGGNFGGSIGGILRVAFSFFTAPFIFLSNALAGMRTSGEEEQHYRGSRIFMMFRWSKLLYLGLLIWCLLILSGGITSSLLTLYPSYEIEQGRLLDEQIVDLQSRVATANEAVADAGAPEYRQQLQAQRNDARGAYQRQVQSNANFVQNTTFSGPIISQLANTRSAYTIDNIRSNIDSYMSGCPRGYNWRGMTVETCGQYRAFLLELADRRMREFQLENAAAEAERAYRDADSAAQNAAANLAALQAQLQATRAQREAISLFNPEVMTRRIATAGGSLLLTFLSVIITVWLGATLLSLFSWLTLMMRGLEQLMAQRLKEARPEEEPA